MSVPCNPESNDAGKQGEFVPVAELELPVRWLDCEGRIAVDAACPACDYNLRGIDQKGRCPECGLALRVNIRTTLAHADPGWVQYLEIGVSLLRFAFLCALLLPIAVPVAVVGAWFISSPNPAQAGDYAAPRRYALRLGTVLLPMISLAAFDIWGRWPAAGVAVLCAALFLLLIAAQLESVADNLTCHLLVRRARRMVRWHVGACCLAIGFSLLLGALCWSPPTGRGAAGVEYLTAVCVVGVIVAVVLWMRFLKQLSTALECAAADARENDTDVMA